MKKRILSLLLCLLIAVLLLSACDMGIADAGTSGTKTTSKVTTPSGTPSTGTSPGYRPDGDHTDADDDGICDDCGISVVVSVDFFAINDLHGKFDDADGQEGVDELTTYLRRAQENGTTVLLSSGDMWQGSAESNLTKGMLVTDWMSQLGFASMTLGNHEFDWSTTYIQKNGDFASFPLLAINVYDKETDRPVDFCEPSVMVEKGGMKIGIIGAIGDCLNSISGEKAEGLTFKVGEDLTALVKAESVRLREAGADFIVYSLHDGYEDSVYGTKTVKDADIASYYDISLSREGYVDLVFEGHTHQRYVLKDTSGIYHLQNGGENKGISHAVASINFANGKRSVTRAEFVSTGSYASLPDDPLVDSLLEKYADAISKANRVVGTNDAYMNSNSLKALTAQLYYENGAAKWGDQYDIVLGGGFLSVRNPYSLPAGEVTYGDLMSLLPFDNTVVLCSLSGAKLRDRFIETDNNNYFLYYGSYGEQVKNSIKSNATYYIVTDTYNAYYAPNGLTIVDIYAEEVYARDMVADWLGGPRTQSAYAEAAAGITQIVFVLPQMLSESFGKRI